MPRDALARSCRACMNENPAQLFDWNSLVDDVDVRLSYAECFQKCTQLDATEDLPQIMCYDCGFELREAYLFISKARMTHWKLRRIQDMRVKQSQDDDVTVDIEITTKDSDESELDTIKFVFSDTAECDDTNPSSPLPEIQMVEQVLVDEVPPSPQLPPASEDVEQTRDVAVVQKQNEVAACKICHKNFPKTSMSTHMAQVHVEKNFLCHICSRTYKTQHALNRHCLSHEDRVSDKIKCELCGHTFARRACYKTHMLTHKKDRKATFSCDECNKSFFTKNGLTWHKKFHTGDTFNCSLCDKPFARAVDLKKHMLYHSNVKPYKCPQCDHCFRDVYVLNQHLRTKHQGYMYKCDFCDKEYASVSSLDKHRGTHMGLPNQCDICGKGFWSKPKLVEHLKKDHQVAEHELETYIVYAEKVYRPRRRHVLQIKPKNGNL